MTKQSVPPDLESMSTSSDSESSGGEIFSVRDDLPMNLLKWIAEGASEETAEEIVPLCETASLPRPSQRSKSISPQRIDSKPVSQRSLRSSMRCASQGIHTVKAGARSMPNLSRNSLYEHARHFQILAHVQDYHVSERVTTPQFAVGSRHAVGTSPSPPSWLPGSYGWQPPGAKVRLGDAYAFHEPGEKVRGNLALIERWRLEKERLKPRRAVLASTGTRQRHS